MNCELPKLSIINPDLIPDPGILVDGKNKFEMEFDFNKNDVQWIFYGNPYETIVNLNGSVESKYGFEHSIGYIESFLEPDIKYDVILGLLIKRIETDYNSDSESDSESNLMNSKSESYQFDYDYYLNDEIKIEDKHICKKIKTNHYFKNNLFERNSFLIDSNYLMDFEFGFNKKKVIYKLKGIPKNKFNKYGFKYARGILISNEGNKFKLEYGKILII